MCRITASSLEVKVQSDILSAGTGTVLPLNSRQHSKSTLRLSPFRKVAKSARINLNRYWGLLSQSSLAKSPEPRAQDLSQEEQENRFNELLEAQSEAAVGDNEVNSLYESSPEFARHCPRWSSDSLHSSLTSLDSFSSTASDLVKVRLTRR